MVGLGAEAEAAVRAANGAPAQLRLLVNSTISEFIATPLTEAFTRHRNGAVEASSGVATIAEMRALLADRLADVALGPAVPVEGDRTLITEPVLRYLVVAAAAPQKRFTGPPRTWPWLVGPSGVDPYGDIGRLLRAFRVPDQRISVFPNETAAWVAAADGHGVTPAVSTLLHSHVRRGELHVVATDVTPVQGTWYATTLRTDRRTTTSTSFVNFLSTPSAMQLMCSPGAGVPPSRFRPPVYVTIWS